LKGVAMDKDVTIVRIYLSEADHGHRKSLMQEIMNILHDQHKVKGVTVFRGIAGFGHSGEVHAADMLRIVVDLPLVIEFFDEPEVVQSVLELVKGLLPEGQIVWWTATCR
jgi:hypothetical protein